MRALEPWVVRPLQDFVSESSARLTLLMTTSGQVVAQHGFTGALDLMSAAALGAAIISSSSEIARADGIGRRSGTWCIRASAQAHYLAWFDTPQRALDRHSWSSARRPISAWYKSSSSRWSKSWPPAAPVESAPQGSARRGFRAGTQREPAGSFRTLGSHVARQLHDPRDHLQDRLLRTGTVRQDDQPAVHLRPGARLAPGPHGLSRDPDRSHPLLRFPAPRPRRHLRVHAPGSSSTPSRGRSTTTPPGSWCCRAPTVWSSWPTARPGDWTTTWRACRTCRPTCWRRAWTCASSPWCSSTTSRTCRRTWSSRRASWTTR